MCADENEDLVEKPAYLYLFDGRYPEGSTSNDKRVIRRKAATLTLRDGEVFYQKEFDWAKGKYIHCACALYGIHALMTSIKQEVFEVRYTFAAARNVANWRVSAKSQRFLHYQLSIYSFKCC